LRYLRIYRKSAIVVGNEVLGKKAICRCYLCNVPDAERSESGKGFDDPFARQGGRGKWSTDG